MTFETESKIVKLAILRLEKKARETQCVEQQKALIEAKFELQAAYNEIIREMRADGNLPSSSDK